MTDKHKNSIPDISNPFDLFDQWFKEALDCPDIKDATAMTLSTVDEHGHPWTRVVLLKDRSDAGFSFFTNRGSIKGGHLKNDPNVALCFYWPALDRQIRIMGEATQASDEESDAYFAKRPRESQLGAWASIQSTELDARTTLIDRMADVTQQYEGQDVPRPPFWGGFIVSPRVIEFWSARPHRLHDRAIYTRDSNGDWTQKGLYP